MKLTYIRCSVRVGGLINWSHLIFIQHEYHSNISVSYSMSITAIKHLICIYCYDTHPVRYRYQWPFAVILVLYDTDVDALLLAKQSISILCMSIILSHQYLYHTV